MKQVLLSAAGRVEVVEVPVPMSPDDGVLVRNAYSLISSGTESAAVTRHGGVLGLVEKVRGSSGRARQVWDMAQSIGLKRTWEIVQARLAEHTPIGYSSAGQVVQTAASSPFAVGDRVVAMGTGYANHAEYAAVPRALAARVAEGVSLRQAAFAALGCIAMQGIRRLELTPGERIAVVGLGLIGQVCARLLVAMGYEAFGMDVEERRVAKALEVPGVDAWTIGEADVVRLVRERTGGQMLDGVVLCAATPSDEPVQWACDLCRPRGRISVVGDVGLGLARAKMYTKELELRLSCSYGPGRHDRAYELAGQDYPIGHVRWTEGRNLELFLRLLETGRLDLEPLVSACVPVADAPAAYARLKQGDSSVFGVLLDYGPPGEPAAPVPRTLRLVRSGGAAQSRSDGRIALGVIGVGGYAKAVHLPNLRRLAARFDVRGLASRSGATAAVEARRLGIPMATSDYRELLADPAIDAVLVATRHASHAAIVLDALEAGKHVFVEKPMTTTVEDGEAIVAKAAATGLVVRVGFNRRFAPHLVAMREVIGTRGARLLTVRVNVGALGDDWSNTPEEGGRLLGEGVHFFDLGHWFFDAQPESLAAVITGEPTATNPNVAILVRYPGGCAAQIVYTTLGHKGLGKEYYEALGNGRSVRCDDFRTLSAHGAAVSVRRRDRGDKGQLRALEEFAAAIRGEPYAVVGADAAAGLLATRMALAVPASARTGEMVRLASEGSGLRVQGSGFRVQDSGFRVQATG